MSLVLAIGFGRAKTPQMDLSQTVIRVSARITACRDRECRRERKNLEGDGHGVGGMRSHRAFFTLLGVLTVGMVGCAPQAEPDWATAQAAAPEFEGAVSGRDGSSAQHFSGG
ncbi:hypothetical protein [Microbacterium sp. CPCC 204701]|uniref:hypothetical protein n=1 Tax=Microbacterium sp. CPCC 204701 TaxID=2493084 RepID=UPI000FD886AC|nr:hypothetical protein [Microbacterium sp. CPCC 204701]